MSSIASATAHDRTLAPRRWLVLGLALLTLYGLAALFPRGETWGIHAAAYLPAWARITLFLVAAGLLFPGTQDSALRTLDRCTRALLGGPRRSLLLVLAGVAAAFMVFYAFPIRTEVYGDTRTILRHWNDNAALATTWWRSLVDLRLEQNDAALTEVLLRTMARAFSLPIERAFRLASAASGALYLGVWTLFVRRTFSASRWRAIVWFTGCATGAGQAFFGHVETYAFVSLAMLVLLVASWMKLKEGLSSWTLALLFLFALKAHALTLCFAPAMVFVLLHGASRRHPALARMLRWGPVIRWLVVPAIAVGIALYTLHFRAVSGSHMADGARSAPMFLPVSPTGAPWRYGLFSGAHLLDLANVFCLVGVPGLFVVVGLVGFHRADIDWHAPVVIFAVLAMLFPALFFFAVNPLLSMPRDWDLFSLLATPLLLLLAALLSHSRAEAVPRRSVVGTATGFAVFSLAAAALNAYPAGLSSRLEAVGEHVFRTYHASGSYILGSAQGMDPDTTRGIARRLATLDRLPPPVAGDAEYTHLLMMLAENYRARGDRPRALQCVERASTIAPSDVSLALYRTDYLLWAGQAKRAQRSADAVLAADSRNFDALVLGAVACARQDDYAHALAYLTRADVLRPGDADVASWTAEMQAKQAVSGATDTVSAEPDRI